MDITVLIADHEKNVRDTISSSLEREGIKVITATDGTMAYNLAVKFVPDLILLDIRIPEYNSFEICKKIRSNPKTEGIYIAFLTDMVDEIDYVIGLEIGADDYIEKTITPRLLLARIKSIVRRLKGTAKIKSSIRSTAINIIAAPDLITIDTLTINQSSYSIYIDGKKVIFPKKEFQLLAFLASNRGKVFDRDLLLQQIWNNESYIKERTVDVHMSKVRNKLGTYSFYIETVKGVGYRFKGQ